MLYKLAAVIFIAIAIALIVGELLTRPRVVYFRGPAIVGRRLYNRAKKIQTSTIIDGTLNDRRRPVLYLRPFTFDTETEAPVSQGGWADIFAFSTEEEQLVRILSAIGPVVTAHKPGAKLPELGAHRVQLADSQWRERVTEMAREAALVVLRLVRKRIFGGRRSW